MEFLNLLPARQRLKESQEAKDFFMKKSLGQNFLVNDQVIYKILKAAYEFQPKHIVEIGPGLGALTEGLLQFPNSLELIEIDSRLITYWKAKGFSVKEGDALSFSENDFSSFYPYILVSNLPYQIAASIVVEKSIENPTLCSGMVLMFQKEVAQKIKAEPGHSDFGFLSVLSQTFWKITKLVDARPNDFEPPPKVMSRVLRFERKNVNIKNRPFYLKFIKAAFLHPRKYLISNISQGLNLEKAVLENHFKKLGIDLQIRGHQLSLNQFLILFDLILEGQ